jgi:hypothetical protein
MASPNVKTTKPAPKKVSHVRAPACRRCGAECQCSEEEIDQGGPA